MPRRDDHHTGVRIKEQRKLARLTNISRRTPETLGHLAAWIGL
ncbi:hypothetical protein [Streptomyces sp. NPDC059176]